MCEGVTVINAMCIVARGPLSINLLAHEIVSSLDNQQPASLSIIVYENKHGFVMRSNEDAFHQHNSMPKNSPFSLTLCGMME